MIYLRGQGARIAGCLHMTVQTAVLIGEFLLVRIQDPVHFDPWIRDG